VYFTPMKVLGVVNAVWVDDFFVLVREQCEGRFIFFDEFTFNSLAVGRTLAHETRNFNGFRDPTSVASVEC